MAFDAGFTHYDDPPPAQPVPQVLAVRLGGRADAARLATANPRAVVAAEGGTLDP
ncbi:MAG TPA: hypothetical protein VMV92_18475 [Streptosporangiaceae bacterium]|nr:hypothetical protein [Streptosporangiaceae bacterium]HUZ50956.1 hypothetical protein [Streptosporangiaceae bacterium]